MLVRHGPTEWSVSGRHTGRTDLPLIEEGRRQAELLREPLGEYSFARILTSPLSRASDTCRLAGLDERAERRPELMEWDYGEYDGLTTPEIREKRPGWLLWRDGCPGGETAADVAARVDRVIEEVRDNEAGDVALFAHGHLLRVLAARWLGLGPEGGACLALTTATISVMGWEREVPVVWLWNDGSHLRQAGRKPAA